MKTVIVGINSKYIHSSLSVLCLKSYCDSNSTVDEIGETITREFTINDIYDSILYGILSLSPDIVAISCYIWNINVVSRLISDLKKIKRDLVIIIGGPEVSYGIDHTNIDKTCVDFIVQGEGEVAFLNLLKKINSNSKVSGNIIIEQVMTSSDEVPRMYDEEYFSMNANKILYYESSRGCPFSCAYCLSSRCGAVRYLSLDRVFEDLQLFISREVKQVKFVDRTFNVNLGRAKSIIKYIVDNANDKDINFHFEIGGDIFDEEFLNLLKQGKPGLIQFEIGIQSTNVETLNESARVMPLEDIFHNVRSIMAMENINIHLDLIVGLPYESYELFKKSFNDVYSLAPHQLQVGFLKFLKGSHFEELVDKHGYVFSNHAPYEVLSNNYISNHEIIFLKQFEDCFNMLYNSRRFVDSLNYLQQFFSSPFVMYEEFTKFIESKELAFASLSSRRLYDLVTEFASENIPNIDTSRLNEVLLFDFYASDKSESVPQSLADVADFSKETRNAIKELIKENTNLSFHKYAGRLIDDKCYIFNYSNKNPVSERYDLVLTTEF